MKTFTLKSVEIEDSVDFNSTEWSSFILEHPEYEGLGYLGQISFQMELSEDEWGGKLMRYGFQSSYTRASKIAAWR